MSTGTIEWYKGTEKLYWLFRCTGVVQWYWGSALLAQRYTRKGLKQGYTNTRRVQVYKYTCFYSEYTRVETELHGYTFCTCVE
jgi:hypothetical protein